MSKPERKYYIPEKDLYVLWILSNYKELKSKDWLNFEDLTALGSSRLLTISIINNWRKSFDIQFEKLELVRGRFCYDGFCQDEIDRNNAFAKEKPEAGVNKSISKVYSGKFDFDDLHNAFFRLSCGLEFFEFVPYITPKPQKEIDEFILYYIKDYIEDKLYSENINFFPFPNQFHITYGILKKYIDQFGTTFTLEFGHLNFKDSEGMMPQEESPYLCIHNLVALEKLSYIKIHRIWISDWDLAPEEQRETYKVKLEVTDKLLEFVGDIDPKVSIEFADEAPKETSPEEKDRVEKAKEYLRLQKKKEAKFFLKITDEGRIILNDQYLLSKPRFGSENHSFISFCINHNDRFQITTKEILEKFPEGFTFKKSPHSILDDLGLRPEIKRIFFPKSTREAIEFRNYLSQKEIDELPINQKKLQSELASLKKLSKKELETIGKGWY